MVRQDGEKDTSIADDDFPRDFVEDHLIEDVNNLADHLVILLLRCRNTERNNIVYLYT